jgi:dihydrofolate reductase
MRKVFLFNLMSIDGYFADKDGGLEWHNVDDEFNEFAVEQMSQTGDIIFGRKTYEMMYAYWPGALDDSTISGEDKKVAQFMNDRPKLVVSRTLDKVDWNNTTLVKDSVPEAIRKLKEQPGKDIIILGSANLASSLIPEGLIDEFHILLNPVVLGEGKPLFLNKDKLNLKLVSNRTFQSGNVLLCYEPTVS